MQRCGSEVNRWSKLLGGLSSEPDFLSAEVGRWSKKLQSLSSELGD
ncbi:hypothetical protein [Rivularia sp. UHCC 0363]|nr:hypothetical protein [Rivularia sp. UHCC 0363]MEA5599316.1 hypothetical protein [Rivularia sp. UHCC 0363]